MLPRLLPRLPVLSDETHWIPKRGNSKFWYAEFCGWQARWPAVPPSP